MTGILHALVEDAAREAGCTLAEMLGPSRRRPVATCRQAAMRAALDAGFSSPQIGRVFNRDHTTVLYAAKRLSRTVTASQLPIEQRLRILADFDGKCGYCGSYDWVGIDHIIPSSRGGSDKDENLTACCRACNSSKGNRTPEEWRRVSRGAV